MGNYLDDAYAKFRNCVHNIKGRKCSLDGYPVLDCPHCTSYKSREEDINDNKNNCDR